MKVSEQLNNEKKPQKYAGCWLNFSTISILVLLTLILFIGWKAKRMKSWREAEMVIEVVASGEIDKLKSLIEKKPRLVNAKGEYGDTPLHVAAASGQLEICNYLIDSGADLNSVAVGGITPLSYAVHYGKKDAVILLLQRGADVNKNEPYTALHQAARTGQKEICEILISNGADVNARGKRYKEGITPLHEAAKGGYKEVCEILISNGANVNAKSEHGYTPLYLANEYGNIEVAEFLRQHGAVE